MKKPQFPRLLTDLIIRGDPNIIYFEKGKIIIQDRSLILPLLSKHFRHCSFESFHRQMNNFGFRVLRKDRGKSKIVYVHRGLSPSSSVSEIQEMLKVKQKPKKRSKQKLVSIVPEHQNSETNKSSSYNTSSEVLGQSKMQSAQNFTDNNLDLSRNVPNISVSDEIGLPQSSYFPVQTSNSLEPYISSQSTSLSPKLPISTQSFMHQNIETNVSIPNRNNQVLYFVPNKTCFPQQLQLQLDNHMNFHNLNHYSSTYPQHNHTQYISTINCLPQNERISNSIADSCSWPQSFVPIKNYQAVQQHLYTQPNSYPYVPSINQMTIPFVGTYSSNELGTVNPGIYDPSNRNYFLYHHPHDSQMLLSSHQFKN